ncbi:MAG: hypothetical protein ABL962_02430 [Fimbriimonadaceae bacterium]
MGHSEASTVATDSRFLDSFKGQVITLRSERVSPSSTAIGPHVQPTLKIEHATLYLIARPAEEVIGAIGNDVGDDALTLTEDGAFANLDGKDFLEIGAVSPKGERQTMVLYTYQREVSTLDEWLCETFPRLGELKFGRIRFVDNRWFDPLDEKFDFKKVWKLHPKMQTPLWRERPLTSP